MPGRPKRPRPCDRCGLEFVPANPSQRFHSDACKLRAYSRVAGSCWYWTKSLNEDGYGRIRAGNQMRLAHVVSFELFHGPVPEGHEVRHTCHNRACVNPVHLVSGTHQDNMDDMVAAGRQSHGGGRPSSLAEWDKEWICWLYSQRRATQQELARRFGVTQTRISQIVRDARRKVAS